MNIAIGITCFTKCRRTTVQIQLLWVPQNLPYETTKWYNLGLGTLTANGTDFGEYQLLSYMGRVNYSYKGKYLFQASMRWDGSSRLAEGNKWNSFPGISVVGE